ncbi:MAG: TIR domain-containing protein [Nitrospirae bacterium]|nr:TIR domain-containing protein [Nitrospirota bacterium]
MLLYRNKQISENSSSSFRDSISVTSREHLKAAALIRLLFYENELERGHYSAAVKKEITAKIVKILSLLSSPVFEKIEIAEYLHGISKDRKSDRLEIAVPDNSQKRQYDVVISFAGEDRDHAGRLAELLKTDGFEVFYDDYEEADLWGKNLYEHLTEVYSKLGKYCVMFLSKHYAAKQWPTLERRAAQERAFKENREYILPIRIDDTSIPGMLDTVGYQDLRQKSIEDIYAVLKRKLLPINALLPIKAEADSIGQLGLSDDAMALLKYLSDKSERALANDPISPAEEVLGALELSEEALGFAADELDEKGFVKLHKTLGMGKAGFRYIGTTELLFSATDKYLRDWNPEDDSITLSQTLIDIAQEGHAVSVQGADETLKWGPRRINPALSLLIDMDMVNPSKAINPDYISIHVILKPKIYRYVKRTKK